MYKGRAACPPIQHSAFIEVTQNQQSLTLLIWEQHVEEVLQGMVRGGVSNEKDLIDR